MNKTIVAAAGALAVLAAGAAGFSGAASGSIRARADAAQGGTWGTAHDIAGAPAHNTGGGADIVLSCPTAGNCTAAGQYQHGFTDARSFVVSERGGTWGTAQRVLLGGKGVALGALSCQSAGNCTAGGVYALSVSNSAAFVVSERGGTWGKAARLHVNGTGVGLSSMACASAGNCSAGGEYVDRFNVTQTWVASEKHGTWGTAQQVPGTGALNRGGYVTLNALSCLSAGNCTGVGVYADNPGGYQAFVVAQRHGTWGTARELPGIGALNRGDHAAAVSLSCPSAGTCETSGFYTDRSGRQQAFVAAEKNGTWGKAQEVPGTGALNQGGSCSQGACVDADAAVSCPSAGTCDASGWYTDRSGRQQAFVAVQRGGRWGKAQEFPGSGALNQGGSANVGVLCKSASNCSAAGYYTDRSSHRQALVAAQRGSAWKMQEVPGTAALNKGGDAQTYSLSCASVGKCSAGGYTTDSSGHPQVFVVNES